jgi:hypothetical protein
MEHLINSMAFSSNLKEFIRNISYELVLSCPELFPDMIIIFPIEE